MAKVKLPPAAWHQQPALKQLVAVLDGDNDGTRYVGGAVRDTLLGLPVKDIDLATKLRPEEVRTRLEEAGIKAIPTGIEHGTITAVLDGKPFEITTLRRDVSTDGRRATVAYSDDWREDAARRDFTINALFADPATLEIADYFDGIVDLEARRIRFIGSPEQRIAEDHLRIMRYFRFLARFGKHDVDQQTFDACRLAAPELAKLSRERIADELMKLLAAEDPLYAIEEMIAADLFTHIVEAIDPNAVQLLAPLIQREQAHDIAPSAVRRLVGLLPKDAQRAGSIAKSLRMSKKLQKAVENRLTVIPAHAGIQSEKDSSTDSLDSRLRGDDIMDDASLIPEPDTIRALAYWVGIDAARDRALLFGAEEDIAAMLTQLGDWEPPTFPLTGGDLIAKGMNPGPEVSKTLARLEQQWVEKGFRMEEAES